MPLSKIKEMPFFRIDSEHYQKSFLDNVDRIKNWPDGFAWLGDEIEEMTGGATPLGAEYPDVGIRFLRVQNVMQNYIDDSNITFITPKDDQKLSRSRLQTDDVLLTITGMSYGKAAVVTPDYAGSNINQHSVRIHFRKGYLFSWEEIPGRDNARLTEILVRNFGIDWIKTEIVEKIDEGKTIYASTGKKFLSLKLNDEKTEVVLEIDGVRTDKFTAKQENGDLNIYKLNFRPHYISTFLNARPGKLQSDQNVTGVTRPALDYSTIRNFVIPCISDELQRAIEVKVKEAHQSFRISRDLTKEAEQTLIRAMGLIDLQLPDPLTYKRRFSEVFAAERLDAEYFAPAYDALLEHIKERGAVRLGDDDVIRERIHRGISPEYVEDGDLIVINSQHVGKTHITINDNRRTLKSLVNHSENDSRSGYVRQGDVLLNSTGVITIGRCQCILDNIVAVADNHIAIIRPRETIDPVYLACFLNSQPGQMQTEQGYTGSSGQIELRPDLIEDFTVWLAPHETQITIRQLVERAHSTRCEAHTLLEQAKRAVEIALEQNERASLYYLNEERGQ